MGRIGADDVVIVTGASRGIGLEAVRRFAARGAAVGMIARDPAELAAAAASIAGTVTAAVADVTDETALGGAIATVVEAHGPVTVLVNNAGHGVWGAAIDTPIAEARRAVEVNYLGAVAATAAVLLTMLTRRRGRIVNVASIAGRAGAPFEAAYSASKFALVGWSEALAGELAGTGVIVSLVDPGPVATDFFARRGHPYELRRPRPVAAGKVADAILAAACSDTPTERFIPRWLRAAMVAKSISPGLSRRGTSRLYADRRAELMRRVSTNPAGTEQGGNDD